MVIDNHTLRMGLIGNPLGHSLSPQMHNQTLARMGLNGIYLPMEVAPQRLGEAVQGLRALNFTGVNVTIPYKQAVIPYLDELSPESRACQAVNLIQHRDGRLIGYNTDGRGFMASLQEEGVDRLNHVLIIGAGGAARAVVYELTQAGAARVDILDVVSERALALAEFVNHRTPGSAAGHLMNQSVFAELCQSADLVVNCTPVGMHPGVDNSPVDSLEGMKPDAVVYDLIYNPPTTRLLGLARARNIHAVNGVGMLVHQGALTLKILTGVQPPVAFMKEVIIHAIEQA
ncbi:MAG: shikimate dehydrogenase [Syntrophomonadaceae bacterium]